MSKVLVQYARDKNRRRIGVVVAYKSHSGHLRVGFSKCHKKDSFDRRLGLNMALKAAVTEDSIEWELVPQALKRLGVHLLERARHYFNPTKTAAKPRKRKARTAVA